MNVPTPTRPRLPRLSRSVVLLVVAEPFIALGVLLLGIPVDKVVTGLIVGLLLSVLAPTLQELGRPRPLLSLAIAGTSDQDGSTLTAAALRPWPVDDERIVAHELQQAEHSVAVGHGALDLIRSMSDPLGSRPSKAEHARAREAFRERLPVHAEELRAWLGEYRSAARAHSELFDVPLRLANSRGAAHAEAVTFVLRLPDTVSVVDERPTMPWPPQTPFYNPPRGRSSFDLGWAGPAMSYRAAVPFLPAARPSAPAVWTERGDGEIEATVGDVHAGRTVEVGETLLLRATGPGTHRLRWTAYSKSNRQHAGGTIDLIVPPDPAGRPAFGRLAGVTSYPDVPLVEEVDDADEEPAEKIHQVRTSDPPPKPTEARIDASDTLGRIRASYAASSWSALGLDPGGDEPVTPPAQIRSAGT